MVSVHGAMTQVRKQRLWVQWREGVPMSVIARNIGKPLATVYSYLLYHGGNEPLPRVRRAGCLSFRERETISRFLAQRQSIRAIARSLATQMNKLPQHLRKSLTWDRGRELCAHKTFTVATNMNVYFCDPSSPWQRGTNENANGLLRQCFPKPTSLAHYSRRGLNQIARQLNARPRKP
jgi:IS30 family transposase